MSSCTTDGAMIQTIPCRYQKQWMDRKNLNHRRASHQVFDMEETCDLSQDYHPTTKFYCAEEIIVITSGPTACCCYYYSWDMVGYIDVALLFIN
jgi:hypothetical protein